MRQIKPTPTLLTTTVVLQQMARVEEDAFDANHVAAQIPSLAEINRDSNVVDALNVDRRSVRFHGLTRIDPDIPLIDKKHSSIPRKVRKSRSMASDTATPGEPTPPSSVPITRAGVLGDRNHEDQSPSSTAACHAVTEGFGCEWRLTHRLT